MGPHLHEAGVSNRQQGAASYSQSRSSIGAGAVQISKRYYE